MKLRESSTNKKDIPKEKNKKKEINKQEKNKEKILGKKRNNTKDVKEDKYKMETRSTAKKKKK